MKIKTLDDYVIFSLYIFLVNKGGLRPRKQKLQGNQTGVGTPKTSENQQMIQPILIYL